MTTPGDLSDAITAAGLVLAVLAVLYTLWLPDVGAALAIIPLPDEDDRGPQRAQVMRALLAKALPLGIATVAATLILLPRGIVIVEEALAHGGTWAYDDIKAMFVLTLALLVVLAIVACAQVYGLVMKRVSL